MRKYLFGEPESKKPKFSIWGMTVIGFILFFILAALMLLRAFSFIIRKSVYNNPYVLTIPLNFKI